MNGLRVPASYSRLPKLNAYIDETGDRGFSEASRAKSPFFAMTALLVPHEEEWNVGFTVGGLRALVHGDNWQHMTTPLHWVEHFKAKKPQRRTRAAKALAAMPGMQVIHVIAHKDTVNADAGMRRDKSVFYNYTTRLLLERVAFAARSWPGGKRLAIARLGTVKHMDHVGTLNYLDYVRSGRAPYGNVPWAHIAWPPRWEGTQRPGIQLADLHAGLLNAALSGDPEDRACAEDLLLCGHQLYRHNGKLLGCGVKVIGDSNFVTDRVWWDDWKDR